MDIFSGHLPYVVAAYGLGICVVTLLTYWTLKVDRKARQQLAREKPDVV